VFKRAGEVVLLRFMEVCETDGLQLHLFLTSTLDKTDGQMHTVHLNPKIYIRLPFRKEAGLLRVCLHISEENYLEFG